MYEVLFGCSPPTSSHPTVRSVCIQVQHRRLARHRERQAPSSADDTVIGWMATVLRRLQLRCDLAFRCSPNSVSIICGTLRRRHTGQRASIGCPWLRYWSMAIFVLLGRTASPVSCGRGRQPPSCSRPSISSARVANQRRGEALQKTACSELPAACWWGSEGEPGAIVQCHGSMSRRRDAILDLFTPCFVQFLTGKLRRLRSNY